MGSEFVNGYESALGAQFNAVKDFRIMTAGVLLI
jgi:hypothetical protein